MGRIFDNPATVFPEDMLKPELQSIEDYVDGINNIVEAQQKVAKAYIEDGSIEAAIPPLKAILYIMAEGKFDGHDINSPEVRNLFNYKNVISSDWYKERLEKKVCLEIVRLTQSLEYLSNIKESMISDLMNEPVIKDISTKIDSVEQELEKAKANDAWKDYIGTIGADLLFKK